MEYDNTEFMNACVDQYRQITGIDKKTLPKVQVPLIEDNMVDLGLGAESEVDPLSNTLAYQSLKELRKYDHPSQFTQQLNRVKHASGPIEGGKSISVGVTAPLSGLGIAEARDAQPYYDEETQSERI